MVLIVNSLRVKPPVTGAIVGELTFDAESRNCPADARPQVNNRPSSEIAAATSGAFDCPLLDTNATDRNRNEVNNSYTGVATVVVGDTVVVGGIEEVDVVVVLVATGVVVVVAGAAVVGGTVVVEVTGTVEVVVVDCSPPDTSTRGIRRLG
jgi:hypothetical protein